MIKEPADPGFHVTYQLHHFILKSYMPQSYLFRYCYEFFFIPHYCRYIGKFFCPDQVDLGGSDLQIP